MSELLNARLAKKHTPPPRPPIKEDAKTVIIKQGVQKATVDIGDSLIETLRMISKELDAKIEESKTSNIGLTEALNDLSANNANLRQDIQDIVKKLDVMAASIESVKTEDPKAAELKQLEKELLMKLKTALSDDGF